MGNLLKEQYRHDQQSTVIRVLVLVKRQYRHDQQSMESRVLVLD